MNYRIWVISQWLFDSITDFCIFIISKVNRYKDRNLSQRLYDLAEDYNTRPGTENYYKENKGESILEV